ncbi:MAG: family 16 glycosylhydrolase [Deltaproteobacteria bacterium]
MKYRCLPLSLAAVSLTVAVEAGAVASAELVQNQTYTYGRFEARIRFAAGDGVISSFFMWKPGSEMAGTFWNELDFEKLGDCRLQTNPLYGLPVVDHHVFATLEADLCSEYHTYTFEWTPTYIAYLVDGVEIRRDGDETAAAFAQNAASGMQIHFNVWPGDASFGGNFDPAILPVQQYISWVQYSSFAGGAFTFQWREEFDGPTLPSGWSVGSWASPKNLSTHQSANVVLSGGLAVLALTADGATGFSGAPPPDLVVGSDPGPDPSAAAGAGGAPATGGSPTVPLMGGAYGGADSGSAPGGAANTGVPSSSSAGAANGVAGTGPTGTSGTPSSTVPSGTPPSSARPPASDGGACSYVASSRTSPQGVAWLALGGAALVLCRRHRRWLQKGRPSSTR